MGYSALSISSANGCVEVVKVLLEFGAQVDLPDNVRWHYELFMIITLNAHVTTE